MRFIPLTALAFVSALFITPAAALTCGGVATVTLTLSTDVGSTCLTPGNGNVLGGGGDPYVALGYVILDTTTTIGLVPLTLTSNTFAFTPNALYDSYALGFQAFTAVPKPDYFGIALAEGIISGGWLLTSGGNSLTLAVLYGQLAEVTVTPVPIPAALILFGSALAGFFGFGKLRKRFAAREPATA